MAQHRPQLTCPAQTRPSNGTGITPRSIKQVPLWARIASTGHNNYACLLTFLRPRPMPPLRKLPLYLLMALLLAALWLAVAFYAGSSRVALGNELDSAVGTGSHLLLPWLYKLSPDLAQCVGAVFHARQQWGWSWPAAVLYGFPGIVLAMPLLVGGLGMLLWPPIGKRLRATRPGSTAADNAPPASDNNEQRRQD